MEKIRLRFAPSPTGALHIGGVRTALYNYFLAKKHNGTFILRIEDTDQTRYVPGAEAYIVEALEWFGIIPDEGPGFGGEYGPYRQSERKALYGEFAQKMIESGHAYYAFDTAAELDAYRQAEKEKGNHNFRYDSSVRLGLKNSLTLSPEEIQQRITSGEPYTIRLKIPENEEVKIHDLVRGEVVFQTNTLDDKIILKGDGMPTYHLANIVDDYHMKITHVVRGEEWLSSTAHHVLLYRALGWEDQMPQFAHLPLILRPNGKGKLSKRDGAKFGFPVFPLSWEDERPEESFIGFREFGFLSGAVINFLVLLGWNPGTEQEIFSLDDLSQTFSIDRINKSGTQFDIDKAKWFNQQYIMASDNAALAALIRPTIEAKGHQPSASFLESFCDLMKSRVVVLTDFWNQGYFFFEDIKTYDTKMIRKKWKPEQRDLFMELSTELGMTNPFQAGKIKETVEGFMNKHSLSFGMIFPVLRLALSGTTKGPGVFEMMELLGQDKVIGRIEKACQTFDQLQNV